MPLPHGVPGETGMAVREGARIPQGVTPRSAGLLAPRCASHDRGHAAPRAATRRSVSVRTVREDPVSMPGSAGDRAHAAPGAGVLHVERTGAPAVPVHAAPQQWRVAVRQASGQKPSAPRARQSVELFDGEPRLPGAPRAPGARAADRGDRGAPLVPLRAAPAKLRRSRNVARRDAPASTLACEPAHVVDGERRAPGTRRAPVPGFHRCRHRQPLVFLRAPPPEATTRVMACREQPPSAPGGDPFQFHERETSRLVRAPRAPGLVRDRDAVLPPHVSLRALPLHSSGLRDVLLREAASTARLGDRAHLLDGPFRSMAGADVAPAPGLDVSAHGPPLMPLCAAPVELGRCVLVVRREELTAPLCRDLSHGHGREPMKTPRRGT